MKLSGSLLAAPALLAAVAAAQAQPHIQQSPELQTACNQAAYINTATTTAFVIVPGIAGEGIYVCGWGLTASAAGSAIIENSPGATCSSISASVTMQLSTSPLVDHQRVYSGAMAAPVGNNLCFAGGNATATVQGFIYYTQF